MLGKYITFPELLLWFPLLTGVIAFFINDSKKVKAWALFSSLVTLGISIVSLCYTKNTSYNVVSYEWMKSIGSSFAVRLDGMSFMLTFLTALSFPLIFLGTYNREYKNTKAFYGLMLLSQCGLMGVFVSIDALLFYFFWELALIPVYFLCSKWGGEKRIAATFKFFIYTFAGSLLMLVGIIYIYLQSPPTVASDHSFAVADFYKTALLPKDQSWLFILFFVAFAIKMPVFPFHTWQPDTYEQSPAPATMVLSGIMVKMGVFALIRWVLPVMPEGTLKFQNIVIILSVAGMLYASCIAIVQDDLKRIVAYSSIAHIGLMSAAIFSLNPTGLQGVMIQMLNHGINIIGLWIVIDLIEKQLGIRKLSQLGGIAQKAPALAIFFVVMVLANMALPLTNAFIGEFTMFTGLYQLNPWYVVFASIAVILVAVYSLNMVQKVFFGNSNSITETIHDITFSQKITLTVIVLFIFILGVYPKPLFQLTEATVTSILTGFGK
jgi:NADH-quinone oxidoreductase subunit M